MSFDLKRVQKSEQRVEKFLRRNSKTPSTAAIHRLRTNTRRLETTFGTLSLHSSAGLKRLLGDLAVVRKRAGKVRDMDVLTADVMNIQQDSEQDCLVQLLEHLGAERKRFARKLRRRIDAANPEFRHNLKRSAKRLLKRLKEADRHPADSAATHAAMARTLSLSSGLMEPVRLSRSNLHEYRLKVKELRNVLQLSAHPDDSTFLKKLDEVKDAIGDWHDWKRLTDIAKDVLQHGPSCELLKHLQKTSDSKFERALKLTEQLRHDYVRAKTPRAKRSSKLSVPVVKAVAAIANT
jgi:CHAD domain-containing protein